MKWPSVQELFARPLVRIVCGVAAVGVLVLVVRHVGVATVFAGLGRSAPYLPVIVLLEAAMLVCSTFALRALYGRDGDRISPRNWASAACLGYVVGVVAPLGRAAAETTRAVMHGRTTGGARATVALIQIQGVALLVNAGMSAITLIGAWALLGADRATLLVLLNTLVTVGLAVALLVGRRFLRPSRWLGGVSARGRDFATAVETTPDAEPTHFTVALLWEGTARVLQFVQTTLAILAVGHVVGPLTALAVQGVQLAGGSFGEALPAQLGATEAALVVAAPALGFSAASAATLALLIHAGQIAVATLSGGAFLLMRRNIGLPAAPMEVQS